MSHSIDLNCDMGESFGAWTMGADAAVLPWVTSANIACGFHAGDPVTMCATVEAAVAAGVAVGAHVGLPDKEGFGRRAMAVSAHEVYAMTVVQLGALLAVARTVGATVGHLKPHGALYHMAEQEADLALAIVEAVRSVDASIRITGLAGGRLLEAAHGSGLGVLHEAFIDRRYLGDGSLAPRARRDAVIDDPATALAQALQLAQEQSVTTVDGECVAIRADTMCIHGDRDAAAQFARHVHEGLIAAGLELRAPASI